MLFSPELQCGDKPQTFALWCWVVLGVVCSGLELLVALSSSRGAALPRSSHRGNACLGGMRREMRGGLPCVRKRKQGRFYRKKNNPLEIYHTTQSWFVEKILLKKSLNLLSIMLSWVKHKKCIWSVLQCLLNYLGIWNQLAEGGGGGGHGEWD